MPGGRPAKQKKNFPGLKNQGSKPLSEAASPPKISKEPSPLSKVVLPLESCLQPSWDFHNFDDIEEEFESEKRTRYLKTGLVLENTVTFVQKKTKKMKMKNFH